MEKKYLSAKNREINLDKMSSKKLDVLVIGGGITGAGIALDASSRGLTIGLIEKQDFSAGTSSRSTKLIHGGLRYLKQGEVKLVQEVGKERAILYRNAPHIVVPEKMFLPMIKGGTYGKFMTSIGLWMYDRLAGVKKEERRIMLSQRETEELEPLLRKDILKGGGLYFEYRTDDARLTIEVMKSATEKGAICVNYAEAISFIYDNQKVVGVKVRDKLSGKEYEIYAKRIVNATGPWVDNLREDDKSLSGKRLHLTKGVHIVFPYEKLPLKQSIYFDVPDGRMIFAIPRGKSTYVGTTDTNYKGSIERPRVHKDDVDYLLHAINNMFPSVELTTENIQSTWAGLRPLIHEDGKAPSELSRKDEIFHSPTGLITIAGGKLTGFRKMAERVVDLVMKQLGEEENWPFKYCITDKIVLSGGDFLGWDENNMESMIPQKIEQYIKELINKYNDFNENREIIQALVKRYGTNTDEILKIAKDLYKEKFTNGEKEEKSNILLIAELRYTIGKEMVTNINDFLIRRSGRMFFERNTLEEIYPLVLDEMTKEFKWNDRQRNEYLEAFTQEYEEALHFIS